MIWKWHICECIIINYIILLGHNVFVKSWKMNLKIFSLIVQSSYITSSWLFNHCFCTKRQKVGCELLFVITPIKHYQKLLPIPLLHSTRLVVEWKHHHGIAPRWTWPSISIVMDVYWKIPVKLHYHSCANGDLIVLWWNWTNFMYVFIKLPKKSTILNVAW
jgi:hypothetical protein